MTDNEEDEVEITLEEFLELVSKEKEVTIPSDGEELNQVPPFQWIRLPNGEAGILVHFLDAARQPVADPQLALTVLAQDRYERLHHWEINEETMFGEVILQ